MDKCDAETQKFLDFLKKRTDDPAEQLLLALGVAQTTLGYVPKEMHFMASIAVAGLGGPNPDNWKILAALVGVAINEKIVSQAEVMGVMERPREFLNTYATEEQAQFQREQAKAPKVPKLEDLPMPTGKPN